MKVEQIYTGCLAQGAYYIESNGEVVIIDPLRETKPYLDKLEKEGVKLKYIFETHFHADFVSGHFDLAKKTGATIIYGPNANSSDSIHVAKDNEELKVGNLTFKILHTPGHTMESSTFLLKDESGKDYAIFSGDTLFIGDVGRPDLAQKMGTTTKEDLAGLLFDSLRDKIMPLADDIIVYPAHGAGSACGKNMSKETWDTLGNQKKTNYALRADMTRDEFIKELTDGLLPPPVYFAKNVAMNKVGYDDFDKVLSRGSVGLSPEEFEMVAEVEEALVLDTRHQSVFQEGFIPNSIFIGIKGGFAPWVGALITDIKQPILIVADEGKEQEVVTRLARVGYDNSLGFLKGGIEAWKKAGKEIDTIASVSPEVLAEELQNKMTETVLDVRRPGEFISEHLAVAKSFPLDYINNNMHKISRTETYFLHCAGGYRSVIAASILKARGFENVINVTKGWAGISQTNAQKTEFVCPTSVTTKQMDAFLAEVI
jgi:glyoxylase-like metal-dependent hydrolase (beta-lactamase superfamily II)/rhodanese-related sulfurtransferase